MIIVLPLISLFCFISCYSGEQDTFVSKYPAQLGVYLPFTLPREYCDQIGWPKAQAKLCCAFKNWDNFDVAYKLLSEIAIPADRRTIRFSHTPYLQAILASQHGRPIEFIIKHLYLALARSCYRCTNDERQIAYQAKQLLRLYASDGNNLARKSLAHKQCRVTSSPKKYKNGVELAFEQLIEIQSRYAATKNLTDDDKAWLGAMIFNMSDIIEERPNSCPEALWFCVNALKLPFLPNQTETILQQYQLLLHLLQKNETGAHIYTHYAQEAAQELKTLAPTVYHQTFLEGLKNIAIPGKARHGYNQLCFAACSRSNLSIATLRKLIPGWESYILSLDNPNNINPYLSLFLVQLVTQSFDNPNKPLIVDSLRSLEKHLATSDSTTNSRLRALVDKLYESNSNNLVTLFKLSKHVFANPALVLKHFGNIVLTPQDLELVPEFMAQLVKAVINSSARPEQQAAAKLLYASYLLQRPFNLASSIQAHCNAIKHITDAFKLHPKYRKPYGPNFGEDLYKISTQYPQVPEFSPIISALQSKAREYDSPTQLFLEGLALFEKISTQRDGLERILKAADYRNYDACMWLSHAHDPENKVRLIKSDIKAAQFYATKIIDTPGDLGLIARMRVVNLDARLSSAEKSAQVYTLENSLCGLENIIAMIRKYENAPVIQYPFLEKAAELGLPTALITLAKKKALGQCPASQCKSDKQYKDLEQATQLVLRALTNADEKFIHAIDKDLQEIKRQFSSKIPAEQAMLDQINTLKRQKDNEHNQLIAAQYQSSSSSTATTTSTKCDKGKKKNRKKR